MQLALHFDEDAARRDGKLFWDFAGALFRQVLELPAPKIVSQVFVGSLLLHERCCHRVQEDGGQFTERFDRDWFKEMAGLWVNPPASLYCTFTEKTIRAATRGSVWVICLASIARTHAPALHQAFAERDCYLGALEVDNTYVPHVVLYPHGLCAFGRVVGRDFSVFWDGTDEGAKDLDSVVRLRAIGFRNVGFESLNGRYSIFDRRHTPEQTILLGKTQKLCEGILADAAERVLSALTDVAPALPEKLHAALDAYSEPGTGEEMSHVAISCRRVIEYAADRLFPPQATPSVTGRSLDNGAYRNRLLAYADKARASNSAIDLIVASTAALAEQLERLEQAVNKGVHADLLDVEGRRCIVRTIMFLDDLVSLKEGAFQIEPELVSLKSFLGE